MVSVSHYLLSSFFTPSTQSSLACHPRPQIFLSRWRHGGGGLAHAGPPQDPFCRVANSDHVCGVRIGVWGMRGNASLLASPLTLIGVRSTCLVIVVLVRAFGKDVPGFALPPQTQASGPALGSSAVHLRPPNKMPSTPATRHLHW